MAMLLLELEWFGTQGRTCMFNNYLNQPPNTSQLALDGALLVPKRGGTVVPKALGVMWVVLCSLGRCHSVRPGLAFGAKQF